MEAKIGQPLPPCTESSHGKASHGSHEASHQSCTIKKLNLWRISFDWQWTFHFCLSRRVFQVHLGKITWNPKMEVWKIMFLFNWMIPRFHVNFQGKNRDLNYPEPRWLLTNRPFNRFNRFNVSPLRVAKLQPLKSSLAAVMAILIDKQNTKTQRWRRNSWRPKKRAGFRTIRESKGEVLLEMRTCDLDSSCAIFS